MYLKALLIWDSVPYKEPQTYDNNGDHKNNVKNKDNKYKSENNLSNISDEDGVTYYT